MERASVNNQDKEIRQPTTPEEVTPEQEQARKEALAKEDNILNPGDRVREPQSLEDKAREVAVNAPDITGDHIVVPTYFVVDEPNGEQKALHHVEDAEEISDVIRQARTNEEGDRTWW
jgi:hypothetical protein